MTNGSKESANHIYDEHEIRMDYRKLTEYLIEKHMTISTMESATSGQIASLITDTEGSSAVLKGAFITYCNEAKIMQGVPAEVIERYTVYSKETAEAMARACAKTYDANIGIGVTGTMGNIDPANPEASTPGKVYFAICFNKTIRDTIYDTGNGTVDETVNETVNVIGNVIVKSYAIELPPQPTRLAYKLAVAKEIYDVLMREIA